MRANASEILDRAALLKDGGSMVIPCSSYAEMETLRTRLYKVRAQLEKKYSSVARAIDITRKVGENKWTIIVSKELTVSGVIIIEDGTARPFKRIESTIESQNSDGTPETNEERRRKLILEDNNLTEEQKIAELLLNVKSPVEPEDTFDEAATKIEKAQGLPAEPDSIHTQQEFEKAALEADKKEQS